MRYVFSTNGSGFTHYVFLSSQECQVPTLLLQEQLVVNCGGDAMVDKFFVATHAVVQRWSAAPLAPNTTNGTTLTNSTVNNTVINGTINGSANNSVTWVLENATVWALDMWRNQSMAFPVTVVCHCFGGVTCPPSSPGVARSWLLGLFTSLGCWASPWSLFRGCSYA